MRSRNSDQRRYFDDDQQRDRGQQYRRYSQGEQGEGDNDRSWGNRWPEERGSNKNNDAYRRNYQEDNYRSGNDRNEHWDQQRGQRQEDRHNLTLKSNYENRYFSGEQGSSRQAFDPSQNDRPGERFAYSQYVHDNRGKGDQQQRRERKGFGGMNRRKNDNQNGGQLNNLGQQRFGSGSMHDGGSGYGNESRYGGYNEYEQRNQGGTDWNQYDNRNARNQGNDDWQNRYGNNYGQGYYGQSENQGWSQGNENTGRDWNEQRNENRGRDRNEQRNENRGRDWNEQRNERGAEWLADDNERSHNVKGQYGSSNYSNIRNRNTGGGTDYNSTDRYYSRTRDNDPFI